MYKQYIRLAMAVVLAASLTMAACGGGDGSGGAVSDDTASTESSSASSTKSSSASASASSSQSSSAQSASSSSADVTPDPMDFGTTTALAGATVNSLIATVTGINTPVYFKVTGIDSEHYDSEYRIDGGAWHYVVVNHPITVTEGQTIQFTVRVPPVALFDTIRFHVKVGNLQTQWVVIPK